MTTSVSRALTPHDERVVAARACCDPRSVRARLEGRKQRSTIAARIDQALRELGITPPSGPPAGTEPPQAA
jgi:hypothetical protein